MEFLNKVTRDATIHCLDLIKIIVDAKGMSPDDINQILEQGALLHKIKKLDELIEQYRPQVSSIYFAACLGVICDKYAPSEFKVKAVVLALSMFSSLSRIPASKAFELILDDCGRIGIPIPDTIAKEVREIAENDNRVLSVYELL